MAWDNNDTVEQNVKNARDVGAQMLATPTGDTRNYRFAGGTLVSDTNPMPVDIGTGCTVDLASGATVSLISGATIGLVSGTEVALVSGTEVALVSGTSVGLVSGTEVALTSGTTLGSGIAGGDAVYSNDRGDFTATVVTGTSNITIAGLRFTLQAINVANGVVKRIRSGVVSSVPLTSISVSGNTLTLADADAFLVGDTVVVSVIGPPKKYDRDVDQGKSTIGNPAWSRTTPAETLVSAQNLTSGYTDYGTEIDMEGYNRLGIFMIADVNSSSGGTTYLKALGKYESAGTDECDIDGIAIETLWTSGATDFKKMYVFNTDGVIPIIQLQAYSTVVTPTPGDLTLVITKAWSGSS